MAWVCGPPAPLSAFAPVPLCLLLCPPLLFPPHFPPLSASGKNEVVNAALMGVVGFFIGGSANIISAAICADMGRLDELRGNAEALATVTGIVDGTGSVGAGKALRCTVVRPVFVEASCLSVRQTVEISAKKLNHIIAFYSQHPDK